MGLDAEAGAGVVPTVAINFRVKQEIVTSLKREARQIAVQRDSDYEYTDLIRDILSARYGGSSEVVLPVQSVEAKPDVPKRQKPHPLPEDWEPSEETMEWVVSTYPALDVERHTEEFKEYWWGQGGKKTNWELTYRNRIRVVGARENSGQEERPIDAERERREEAEHDAKWHFARNERQQLEKTIVPPIFISDAAVMAERYPNVESRSEEWYRLLEEYHRSEVGSERKREYTRMADALEKRPDLTYDLPDPAGYIAYLRKKAAELEY